MDTQVRYLLAYKKLPLLTVDIDEPLLSAVAMMNTYKVGAVLVVHNNNLVGIFTERDILTKVIGQYDPLGIAVGEVMTANPLTISLETTVTEAMTLITENRFRHLPVVDGNKLIGLISSGDLTRWMVQAQESEIHSLHEYISG
jgi:CBS domain-containing protein